MAWKFEQHHLYRVVKEWHQDIHPSMRVDRIMVHDLHVGEVLRFRSPNLGMAEFLDPVGRLLVISGRDAFKVFEPANQAIQQTADAPGTGN